MTKNEDSLSLCIRNIWFSIWLEGYLDSYFRLKSPISESNVTARCECQYSGLPIYWWWKRKELMACQNLYNLQQTLDMFFLGPQKKKSYIKSSFWMYTSICTQYIVCWIELVIEHFTSITSLINKWQLAFGCTAYVV